LRIIHETVAQNFNWRKLHSFCCGTTFNDDPSPPSAKTLRMGRPADLGVFYPGHDGKNGCYHRLQKKAEFHLSAHSIREVFHNAYPYLIHVQSPVK